MDKLYEINDEAAKFYAYQLMGENGIEGLTYLRERGLTDDMIFKFGIGYSNNLVNYLRNMGYSDEIILESGLAVHNDKRGIRDKFIDRVMIPIQNDDSRVIGFAGRVIDDGNPIFLNMSRTPIYDKNKNLFGLNHAKKAGAGFIILCEGYMDVIAMHQAGFNMAVAPVGMSFTIQQAQLLKKYTNTVLIACDRDDAGVKATSRNAKILKEAGIKSRVLDLNPYVDPMEFIKNTSKGTLQNRIQNAQNPFFYEINIRKKNFDMKDPESKTDFHRFLARKLCEFKEPFERDNYIEAVSEKYFIRADYLRNLVTCIENEEEAYSK